MHRDPIPPKRAWTVSAVVSVLVGFWGLLCAGADYLTGEGGWAFLLGAIGLLNLLLAARQVRATVRWQEAHRRFLETEKETR